MKTRLFPKYGLTVCALALPLAGGCMQDTDPMSAKPVVAPAETTLVTNVGVAAVAQSVAAESVPLERAEPAPTRDPKPLPADVKFTLNSAEVLKLAQGGVDESVMLTFITNSTGTFNLGSDHIVYLNDLGVSGAVIAAMIQHDHLLREASGAVSAPTAGAAPAYPPTQSDQAAMAAAAAPQALPEVASAPSPAPETAAPPATTVNYNYFYNSLAPYGTWVEVDGYGSCWQPSAVVLQTGWQPYSHGGRWIYTDCGWYWHSDYSWGWAPFHYGRWLRHHRWGWCWYPGYTWGPAWVTWRYSGDYCGWAPLPPAAYYTSGIGFSYYGSSVGVSFGFGLGWDCYSFVPWRHFWDYRPYRHCVPRHHMTQVYNNTTVINNIVTGNNNTIINRGIPTDRVTRYTKTESRRAAVREAEPAPRGVGNRERLERHGKELVVYRPRLPRSEEPNLGAPTAQAGRPEAHKADLGSSASRRAEVSRRGASLLTPVEAVQPPAATPAQERGLPKSPAVVTRDTGRPAPGAPAARTREAPARGERDRDQADTPKGRTPSRSMLGGSDELKAPRAPNANASVTPTPRVAAQTRQESARSGSVVVIGRKDANSPASPAMGTGGRTPADQPKRDVTSTWSPIPRTDARLALNAPTPAPAVALPSKPAGASPAPTIQSPRPQPSITRSWSAPAAPQPQRQEIPRITRSIQDRPTSGSSYVVHSPPASRPVAPAAPSSAPSYVRPQPAPAPSFTPSHAPSAPTMVSPPRAPSITPSPMPAPSRSMSSDSGRSAPPSSSGRGRGDHRER